MSPVRDRRRLRTGTFLRTLHSLWLFRSVPGTKASPASRDPFPGDPGIRGPLHPPRRRCPPSPYRCGYASVGRLAGCGSSTLSPVPGLFRNGALKAGGGPRSGGTLLVLSSREKGVSRRKANIPGSGTGSERAKGRERSGTSRCALGPRGVIGRVLPLTSPSPAAAIRRGARSNPRCSLCRACPRRPCSPRPTAPASSRCANRS